MYHWSSLLMTVLLCMSNLAHAGWNTTVYIDLAWPPIDDQGDVPFTLQDDALSSSPPNVFPCNPAANSDAALHGPRTDFPITGGSIQIDLFNTTGQLPGREFFADAYFGQAAIDPATDGSGWAYIFGDTYDDFRTGYQCSDPVNVSNVLENAPYFNSQVGYSTSALEGTNITLGVRLWFFGTDHENLVEEIYQCSYLRLVNQEAPNTQDRGLCNNVVPSTIPTTNSGPAPTSSNISKSQPGSKHGISHGATIGIAVGVVIAVAALILIIGYVLFRRRRRLHPTVALDFWVNGMPWRRHQSSDLGNEKSAPTEKSKLASSIEAKGNKSDQEKHDDDSEKGHIHTPEKMAADKTRNLSPHDHGANDQDSIRTGSEAEALPQYEPRRKSEDKVQSEEESKET